jgi:molecular chaperone HtpG
LASQQPTLSETEEYAYGHVLEALSGGLYPNRLDVLREYLQNSYDAVRKFVEEGGKLDDCQIDAAVQGASVTIHDNAGGMDLETLKEYRKIGFSKKPFGLYAGWRGIGKAAGLAVAEKVIVTTAQANSRIGYSLVFQAADMLDEVRKLRKKGENVPFNRLIATFSNIESFDKGPDDHYTSVELHNIKQEMSELTDPATIAAHLSQIAPVPFRPDFAYGRRIEQQLRERVEDYMPLRILVNGTQVYKPYLATWSYESETAVVKEPLFLPVFDNEKELVAFAWYCMNDGKGQLKTPVTVNTRPIDVSGLVYRVYDIRIGNSQLTRTTLWRTTPERAFYAMGEIHVMDDRVEPTSDRNDFVDSLARYELYDACAVIAKDISQRAGQQSRELRAEEKIQSAIGDVQSISTDIGAGKVSRELVPLYIHRVLTASEELEVRIPQSKKQDSVRAGNAALEQAGQLTDQLRLLLEIIPKSDQGPIKVLDITQELGLSEEATRVYCAVAKALGEYFVDFPGFYEKLVERIHAELRRSFEPKDR